MSNPPTFQIGDTVAYTAQFCRSLGAYAGDIPRLRGKITEIKDICGRQFPTVEWNIAEYGTMTINAANLAHVGANMRFCQC